MDEIMFYPEYVLQIGNYYISSGATIRCVSSEESSPDYLKVTLTEEYQEVVSITPGMPVSFVISGNEVFTGTVISSSTETLQAFICKDGSNAFNSNQISGVFNDVTPQDLVSYCLNAHGISKRSISDSYCPSKKVIIKKQSTSDVLSLIDSLWSIKSKHFMLQDTFYWGTNPEQDVYYEFVYGKNIISLDKKNGMYKLYSSAYPSILHGQKIIVNHPIISGSFIVNKVIYDVSTEGFIRTTLFFKEV